MTDGRCAWCDEVMDASKMGTHLKKHVDMTITPGTGRDASKKGKAKGKKKGKAKGKKKGADSQEEEKPAPPPNRDAFVLKIVCPEKPEYWLFLRAHVMSTLSDLDDLLREMWATCCQEHVSRFVVRGEVFSEGGAAEEDDDDDDDDYDDDYDDDDYYDDDDDDDDPFDDPRDLLRHLLGMRQSDSRPLNVPLRDIVAHKTSFWYMFDEMNELEIQITAYATASSIGMDSPIGLLARNEPVEHECSSCHAEHASRSCCACIEKDADSMYCIACAPEHSCGDGRLVPIENTPRAGMCFLQGLSADEREAKEEKMMSGKFTPFRIYRF